MEKDQNQDNTDKASEKDQKSLNQDQKTENLETNNKEQDQEQDQEQEKTPEEKILELEDKLARSFAEMENQRRRFEKEKEEAYEYGGFAFAKEALRSGQKRGLSYKAKKRKSLSLLRLATYERPSLK